MMQMSSVAAYRSIVSLDPCQIVICNMQHTWRVCRTPLHPQPADVDKPEQQWRAGSLYGAALLQALLSDDHPQSLQAWATAAPAVLDALNEALAACSSSEGM